MKLISSFVAALFLFASCHQEKKQPSAISPGTTGMEPDTLRKDSVVFSLFPDTIKPDSTIQPAALFIAGMKQVKENPFSEREKKENWIRYAGTFDSSYAEASRIRLNTMKAWSDSELTESRKLSNDLFYPFSGPDFLNAFQLFPHARRYTLIGLEPIGHIPDFSKMRDTMVSNYFASIMEALEYLFKRGYFITRRMNGDLQSDKVNGVVPVLAIFLARTGNEILYINRARFTDSGRVMDAASEPDSIYRKRKARGVQIWFRKKDSRELCQLLYVKADLSDNGLDLTPGFTKYLEESGERVTYLKSASYLLHYKEFATIRNIIFNRSKALLQDDTGIAYHYFNKDQWNFRYYGNYIKPINDFKTLFQQDLSEAYKSDSARVEKIPFMIGYNWGTRGVNLLYAVKKK